MPSVGGSGSRNVDSGGRQPGGSRKNVTPTSAVQADARVARLASRSSGAVNAKGDGMSDAVRAAATGSAGTSAGETSKGKRRSQPASSSDDEDSLAAAGVVNTSQATATARLKKASNQPVHVFMYDCNTYLTQHSIFLQENISGNKPDQTRPDTSRAQGAPNVSPTSQSQPSQSQLSQVRNDCVFSAAGVSSALTCVFARQAPTQAVGSGDERPGSSGTAQGPTEGGGNEVVDGGGGSEREGDNDDDEDGILDESQTGSTEKGKKRKRNQTPGSNAEAHKLVKRCAVLWMRDPVGPSMGDSTVNTRRSELAREAIRMFKVAGMDQFLNNTDAEVVKKFDKRLKDCATTADKVRKVLFRACYARIMTQIGLAVQ